MIPASCVQTWKLHVKVSTVRCTGLIPGGGMNFEIMPSASSSLDVYCIPVNIVLDMTIRGNATGDDEGIFPQTRFERDEAGGIGTMHQVELMLQWITVANWGVGDL